MILRIAFNVLMFTSVLFLPWWITAIIAISFLFKFTAYEIILWGVFADMLYSASAPSFYNIEFLFTISAIVIFVLAYFIKKRLMFYDI